MTTNKNPYLIIDIETLGTNLQAPVFAVAALNHRGRGIRLKLNAAQQIAAGAIPDQSTLDFWLKQPAAQWLDAYTECAAGTVLKWLKELYLGGEVWTRGNDFDIPILGNLFARMIPDQHDRNWQPWEFWNLHNIRTAEMTTGKNPFAKKTHDPMDDCADQIWILENFYAVIGETTLKTEKRN